MRATFVGSSGSLPKWTPMNVVFLWRATSRSNASYSSCHGGDAGAVERPLRVGAQLVPAFVVGRRRLPERLRIADVDRDRHAQLAGALATMDPGRGSSIASRPRPSGAGNPRPSPLVILRPMRAQPLGLGQRRGHRGAVVLARAHQPEVGRREHGDAPVRPSPRPPAASRATGAAGRGTCPTGSPPRRSPIRSSASRRARCRRARCACGRRCGETAARPASAVAGRGGR